MNIPIVLFNFSTSDLNERNLFNIKDRCSIINLNIDKSGYSEIDENTLQSYIYESKSKIKKNQFLE